MPFSYRCVEKHINLAEHGQQTGAKRLPPGCGEGETFPCYCSAGHSNRMLITSCKLPPSAGLEKNPEKNQGPEAHHELQTIHKSTFWECCVSGQAGDAELFAGRKGDNWKGRKRGKKWKKEKTRQSSMASRTLGWWLSAGTAVPFIVPDGFYMEKIFFNSWVSTFSSSLRAQRCSELSPQPHRDKSRGRQSDRRGFPQKAGRAGHPTTSNTFKIHTINSIQALTRDKQNLCSAVGLVAGGSKKKMSTEGFLFSFCKGKHKERLRKRSETCLQRKMAENKNL